MELGQARTPDWRDAAAYAPLRAADRTVLAWEWLRRVPEYRSAAARAGTSGNPVAAFVWGLHRFEDPARAAPHARPVWTAAALEPVLAASAQRGGGLPSTDLARLSPLLTSVDDRDGQRMLLSDGWRAIRLDVVAGAGTTPLTRLRFTVPGPPQLAAHVLMLRRYDSLVREGRFAPALHPPEPRVRRQLLLLRTADALASGASQREIAAHLIDRDVVSPGWRDAHAAARLQAQRLVRDARCHLAGGYRALLRRPLGAAGDRSRLDPTPGSRR